jgi:general secretion pathway protein D
MKASPQTFRAGRVPGFCQRTLVLTLALQLAVLASAEPVAKPAATAIPDKPESELRITLNFQGAPLDDVLDYLSQEAGFIILREGATSGKVDILSHQPLNREEILELLNTILAEKGFSAVRSGRTLKIVKASNANRNDLPVQSGNDPDKIEKSDAMLTQIIPVRRAKAEELLANIKPMLGPNSTVSANKTSNALVLTDTQTNIRRVVSIIKALDTSISATMSIKVFQIANSKAKSIAEVINKAFEDDSSSSKNSSAIMQQFSRRMRGGGPPNAAQTDTSTASTKVSAVGEENSNCVVVNAPDDMMAYIEQLIKEIDVPTQDAATLEVFPLKYADAEEVAAKIVELFASSTQSSTSANSASQGRGGRQDRGGPPQTNTSTSSRNLQAADITAVADIRTNSVVISASQSTIALIRAMLDKLDSTPAGIAQVYIYKLKNADLETTKEILESMFEDFEDSETFTRSGATGNNGTGFTSGSSNSQNSNRR